MSSQIPALIIGGGNIGQAIKKVVKNNAHVAVWDKDHKKSDAKLKLEDTIAAAELIFICTPSWANREVARGLAQQLGVGYPESGAQNTKKDHPKLQAPNAKLVISVSKGMEPSGKLTSDILKEELGGKCDYGILAGPMIAAELKQGQPTAALAALSNPKKQILLDKLFKNTNLNLSFSHDLRGLALCSVLKNIYAIALGVAAGSGAKTNARSVLTNLALEEMLAIVPLLGGHRETVLGVGGLGDLVTTGWSEKSYNFTAGCEIGQGKKVEDSEGTVAARGIAKLLGKKIDRFTILNTTCRIVRKELRPSYLLKVVA